MKKKSAAWLLLLGLLLFAILDAALLINLHLFEVSHALSENGTVGFLHRALDYRRILIASLGAAVIITCVTAIAAFRVKVYWKITFAFRRQAVRVPFLAVWAVCLICMVLYAGFVSTRSLQRYASDHEEVAAVRQIIADEQRIIHACGEVEGTDGQMYTYTNSLEALERSLSRGARVIELDLKMTADKQLVCVHGSMLIDPDGNAVESVGQITLEQFQSCTLEGGLTPLTFAQVLEYLDRYPDVYLVTDVKNRVISSMSLIADLMGEDIDRAIAQIYHMETYDKVRNLGFRNIILTLYRAREDELQPEALLAFARSRELVGFTFKKKYLKDEAIMAAFRASGVSLYVHTIDDPDTQNSLFAQGIDAVYTNVVPDKEAAS